MWEIKCIFPRAFLLHSSPLLLLQLCQAKGFICEFCQNEEDIIFPFELNKCRTCEGEMLASEVPGASAGSARWLGSAHVSSEFK